MNLLLDTHALLWWLGADPTLSEAAKAAIASPANTVFVSAAVVWEIRIKQAIGKLEVPASFQQVLADQPFEGLPVTLDHAHALADLPMIHRDPFDRLLVAQAQLERLTIVTRDAFISEYGVPTIEA